MKNALLCGLLSAAAASGACAPEGAPDSVASRANPAWPEYDQDTSDVAVWRLASAPRLTIGDRPDDAQHALRQVHLAGRLQDGTVVVVDWRLAPHLRYFAPDGSGVATAAPAGEGPGELNMARSAARGAGDTIHVLDPTIDRITTWAGHGELVGVFSPDTRDLEVASGREVEPFRALYLHSFGAGKVVVEPSTYGGVMPQRDGVVQKQSVLALFDLEGRRTALVDSFPGTEMSCRQRRCMARSFGARPYVAGGDGVFYVSQGTDPVIRIHGEDGSLAGWLPLPWTAQPVTDADIQAIEEAWLERIAEDSRDVMRDDLAATNYPDHMPYHRALVAGRDGRLWVERYGRVGRTEREWAAFDEDGTWMARLTMPEELEPLEFGADYVLVRTQDALDRELVMLYDLVPPG